MENLDKRTAAGLPVLDLNSENLNRGDWSQTPLGPRHSWPAALQCLVNTCLLPIPHCAAIFWGNDLSIIHNLAWGKASGSLDGQGTPAHDLYSGEALASLRASVRGQTVKVGQFFLKNVPADLADSTILLSTLHDENLSRRGVLAQLLHNPHLEIYLPLSGLDDLSRKNPARQTKDTGAQQTGPKNNTPRDSKTQVDSQQTQLFQRFAELLPNGLAILDSNAEAVFVNDVFFSLTTKKGSKEFRAWPDSIYPGDYERVMSEYRKAFSSREELRVEFRCATSSSGEEGGWRLFLLKPLSEEPEAGFICAVVDITEIKQAQIAQEKAATEAQERKEQQERFIDMVSHEIRNPLSAVLHLAEEVKEVAREVKKHPDEAGHLVEDIVDASDTILLCVSHQNTLVDDILSFSKLDSMMLSLVPREVRPKWEFSKALKVFNSEFKAKNIHFHYAMDVSYDRLGLEHVIADLNRMKQVLVNLITNAIKFTATKDGERNITVSMGASVERPTSYPPSVIFFNQENDAFHVDATMKSEWGDGSVMYLMVAVKDTGIGISDDDQAKLFERFRQATPKTQENYGGSGLGLFISRKLCQLHGGDIGVSSKAGEGSTFGFFFKVRLSNGASEDGRPPFSSRSASENSNIPKRSTTPRPDLSRANSALKKIKEGETEHDAEQLDLAGINDSLTNPPTEFHKEAHPSPHEEDERFQQTKSIAERIESKRPTMAHSSESRASILERGETEHQADVANEGTRLQTKQESSQQHNTILLVEDNLINQKVLRRQLQARGFEVSVANNGQEAIDAVEERGRPTDEHSSRRNFYDCILMDQEMPIKDGNAATMEIRELQDQGKAGRSPILGVSANVRDAQTQSMRDAGMDAVISKPFKVDDLVKKIKGLLPDP